MEDPSASSGNELLSLLSAGTLVELLAFSSLEDSMRLGVACIAWRAVFDTELCTLLFKARFGWRLLCHPSGLPSSGECDVTDDVTVGGSSVTPQAYPHQVSVTSLTTLLLAAPLSPLRSTLLRRGAPAASLDASPFIRRPR